jgi:hypothetical protein
VTLFGTEPECQHQRWDRTPNGPVCRKCGHRFNLPIDGETYEEPRDGARLKTAFQRVKDYMESGHSHTLWEIAVACKCSEASASARLRDLRKTRGDFPGWTIKRGYLENGKWRYWRVLPT